MGTMDGAMQRFAITVVGRSQTTDLSTTLASRMIPWGGTRAVVAPTGYTGT